MPSRAQTLLEALDRFLESAHNARKRRALAPIERTLERAMQRAFRAQGRAFTRRLAKLRSRFPKTDEPVQEALPPRKPPDPPDPPGPGDWEPLFDQAALATLQLFVKPIDKAARQALAAGALATIAEVQATLRFDLKNPRAVAWLKDYAAERVTRINDTTKKQMGRLITEAVDQGWSYDRLARAITERYQEFAVGKPQQHIDSRAHLVAVTEAGDAYAEGNMIVARDMADAGIDMEKAWQTVGDDRVSDGCRGNEAAGWIPYNHDFPSGHQRPLRFPGCRCDLLIRRKRQQRRA